MTERTIYEKAGVERICQDIHDKKIDLSKIVEDKPCTISPSFIMGKLMLKTLDETRKFNTYNLSRTDSEYFLKATDRYLKQNNLYLGEASFRPQKLGGLIPYKLEGRLYRRHDRGDKDDRRQTNR